MGCLLHPQNNFIMTQADVYEKVKKQLKDGTLEIKATKVIVPSLGFRFDNDIQEKLLAFESLAKHYGTIGDKKKAEKIKNNRRQFINDGYSGYYEEVYDPYYLTLSDYVKLANKDKDPSKWSGYVYEMNLGDIFEDYFKRCNSYNSEYLYDQIKNFAKYMPILQHLFPEYHELNLGSGYCCDDCDGDYEYYKSSRLEHEMWKIKAILDKVRIKL